MTAGSLLPTMPTQWAMFSISHYVLLRNRASWLDSTSLYYTNAALHWWHGIHNDANFMHNSRTIELCLLVTMYVINIAMPTSRPAWGDWHKKVWDRAWQIVRSHTLAKKPIKGTPHESRMAEGESAATTYQYVAVNLNGANKVSSGRGAD